MGPILTEGNNISLPRLWNHAKKVMANHLLIPVHAVNRLCGQFSVENLTPHFSILRYWQARNHTWFRPRLLWLIQICGQFSIENLQHPHVSILQKVQTDRPVLEHPRFRPRLWGIIPPVCEQFSVENLTPHFSILWYWQARKHTSLGLDYYQAKSSFVDSSLLRTWRPHVSILLTDRPVNTQGLGLDY